MMEDGFLTYSNSENGQFKKHAQKNFEEHKLPSWTDQKKLPRQKMIQPVSTNSKTVFVAYVKKRPCFASKEKKANQKTLGRCLLCIIQVQGIS